MQQALPLWAPQGAETYYYCTTCFNYKFQNPSQCHAVHEVQVCIPCKIPVFDSSRMAAYASRAAASQWNCNEFVGACKYDLMSVWVRRHPILDSSTTPGGICGQLEQQTSQAKAWRDIHGELCSGELQGAKPSIIIPPRTKMQPLSCADAMLISFAGGGSHSPCSSSRCMQIRLVSGCLQGRFFLMLRLNS